MSLTISELSILKKLRSTFNFSAWFSRLNSTKLASVTFRVNRQRLAATLKFQASRLWETSFCIISLQEDCWYY